jgi:hypothetical protein
MILGDVEETVTSVEIDDSTYEEIIRVRRHRPRRRHAHAHVSHARTSW